MRLLIWLQPHEDEVPDQVSLAQLPASRIHALKNELRVVLIPAECYVHYDKLCQPFTHRGQVIVAFCNPRLKEGEVLIDTDGTFFGLIASGDKGDQ
jgi:hypothetical protein